MKKNKKKENQNFFKDILTDKGLRFLKGCVSCFIATIICIAILLLTLYIFYETSG